ncbi:MAG: DUF436 family protein, partial [Tumebacillaceae bacterium]
MLMEEFAAIKQQTLQVIDELQAQAGLDSHQILVIGCSSSEVVGQRIGTGGSMDAAQVIVEAVLEARVRYGFHIAFQCCEHLNRALVIERDTLQAFGLDDVTVVPVPKAGGSVASTA